MFPCVCVYIFRFEKVNVRRLRSNAKIIGKIICGGGAIYMTFIKGTKLLNTQLPIPPKSLLGLEGQNLTLGYLFFIVNTCCASFWVIQQAMSQGYAIELYFDPALENQVLKALNVLARCQIGTQLFEIES
ncbi:hypothetical protein FF1_013462 [Malus domestica]